MVRAALVKGRTAGPPQEREIPEDVADFLADVYPVDGLTVELVLFHDVVEFAALGADAYGAVQEVLYLMR